MVRRSILSLALVGLPCLALMRPGFVPAEEPPVKPADATKEEAKEAPAKRPDPKPLADYTKKALGYLAGQQNADGGWGQGGGWRTGGQNGARVEGADVKDPSDVGNTCVAVLALMRSGSTPVEGEYASQLAKGVEFIRKHVESADRESIWVTDVRDTQLQSKIGQYVDTFLAALVLSELKGKVPADKGGSQIEVALQKTIAKIEANQKEDGTFAGNHGWASVLSQGLASKALNRAVQNGVQVKGETLKRDFAQAQQSLAQAGGKAGDVLPATPPTAAAEAPTSTVLIGGTKRAGSTPAAAASTDAGVKIYNYSANSGRINDQAISQLAEQAKAQAVLESTTATPEAKQQARVDIEHFAKVAKANDEAIGDIVKQLGDKQFIAGFGNNGGEEFLSYMNISETLLAKGGDPWTKWDKSIAENIARVQNQDGSWSGQHCITGRTFCTAAALLTLMADRAPVPIIAKLNEVKK